MSARAFLLPCLLLLPAVARGQPATQQPAPQQPAPRRPAPGRDAPPARTGFQMALRLGWMSPAGNTSGASGDSLPARFSGQLPLLLGLGGKITDSLYVGGYLGASFGSDGSDVRVERACTDSDDNLHNDIACNSMTLRIGLEAQYHFMPSASVNPWLGYGIGPELASQSITDRVRARDENTTVTGWEYARLAFGVDFRLARGIGGGPLLEGTLGEFTHSRTEINGKVAHTGAISNTALHGWVSLGVRFVLFP